MLSDLRSSFRDADQTQHSGAKRSRFLTADVLPDGILSRSRPRVDRIMNVTGEK
jgi:hypothetical protein